MKTKRFISTGLVAMLCLSMAACGKSNDVSEAPSGVVSETESEVTTEVTTEAAQPEIEQVAISEVTEMQAGPFSLLVCYPEDNAADTSEVMTTCTAPVFLVFGDGKMDEESASAYATTSGLAAIAAKEGSSVVFVNPLGDTWSDDDAQFAELFTNSFSDSSTAEIKNGISESVNFMTQEMEQKIVGTTQRVYVYGVKSGADFALKNIVKNLSGSVTYGDGVTIEFNNTVAGATLMELSDASSVEESDVPVVSIGNSEDINNTLSEYVGNLTTSDVCDYPALYNDVTSNYRRQAGVLLPVYKWANEGIVETVESYEVATSADNVTFQGQDSHVINYVTYYDENLDVENGNVPLVFCFHGGGNTALYEAQATEWPLIGKEAGFITVSVDLHFPNCTPTEIVALLEHLETEYSIDASRIYASGFSMGGCKSWDLYEQYPDVFAGLAPMDATAEPGEDSFGVKVETINTDTIVPVFYVGGEMSPLPELPCQDEKVLNRVKYLFQTNQVTKVCDTSFEAKDSWENPIWSVNGDESYDVPDTKAFKDSVLTVQTFESADGNTYTALACASNQSHEVYARNSWAAWDFLSKFSRAEDGSIVIAE